MLDLKLLEENVGSMLFDISLRNIEFTSSGKGNKSKKRLYQTKKLLHSKGNCLQNEKAVYWMGEDIFKWYIQRSHTTD